MSLDTAGVSDAHYAAVGKVASAWALFELMIDAGTWNLAEIEPKLGACLTAQISGSGRKLDAVISLARFRKVNDNHISKLNKIAESTQKLAERRNRIVHDPWMLRDGLTHRIEATARKRLVLEHKPVKTEAVEALAAEILDLTETFETLVNQITDELSTSAETLPPA